MLLKRGAAIACLLALTFPMTIAAAYAKEDPARVVREAVVTTLGADGSAVETTVSQLIHLDAERGDVEIRVPKVAELESYRNLSGFRNPSGEGDDLVWRTGGRLDARALARFGGDLPIEIDVRYFLDGMLIEADELKRRSGNVKIEVEIANISSEAKLLEYKAATSPYLTSVVNQYIPFQYQVRAEFPTDRWSDVTGGGVHVTNDGPNEVVSASGLLSPPLTDATQVVTFEARSDDVLAPRIQVFAFPGIAQSFLDSMQEQFEALQALYGGVGSISENIGKIEDGVLEMTDGAEAMLDGVGERDEDSGKGVVVKDDKGKTTTLLGGLQSTKDSYDNDLIPGMDELIGGVEGMIASLRSGDASEPGLVEGLQLVAGGLEQLKSGLSSGDLADPGAAEGLTLINVGLQQLGDGLSSGDLADPGAAEGLILINGGLEQLKAGLQSGNPADPGAIEALTLVSQGLTEFFNSVDEHPNVEDSNPVTPPGTPTDFIEALGAIKTLSTAALATNPAVFGQILSILDGVDIPPAGAGPEDVPGLLGKIGSRDPATGVPNLKFDSPACAPACASDAITALFVMMSILDGNPSLGIDTGVIDGLGDAVTGVNDMQAGLADILDGLDDADAGIVSMQAGLTQIIAGLDGADSGIVQMQAGLAEILAGIGEVDPSSGLPVIALDENGEPTTLLGALGFIKTVALESPAWTQAQSALGGKTPKEYFQECPGCFDPDHKAFDPATAGFEPGFRDAFVLFSEGLEDAIKELQTFDDADPGLVDGLEQLRGGLQQVGQGLFAVDELGLRTMRGQIGDTGDQVARDKATLEDKGNAIRDESVLAADVDLASATYVFELPAQQTAARDNLVRAALLAVVLAGISVLARGLRGLDLS